MQVSAISVREMAARQSASRGRGTMGRLSASASSEKGRQTALAKSPPRWARPTTACWAPFMPPGSGAIRATATTMRTIAQAPKPKRPSRAVSTTPAAACQTSRKPASTSTPALKANSMSPTAEGRSRPSPPRKDSTSRVAPSVSANSPRSMDWPNAGSGGGTAAIPDPATATSSTSHQRPERDAMPLRPPAIRPMLPVSSRPSASQPGTARLRARVSPGVSPRRLCQTAQHRHLARVRDRAAELGREQETDTRAGERAHGFSWRRPPGWRGREGGACPRSPARGRRRRWRRAARRCGSAASRA